MPNTTDKLKFWDELHICQAIIPFLLRSLVTVVSHSFLWRISKNIVGRQLAHVIWTKSWPTPKLTFDSLALLVNPTLVNAMAAIAKAILVAFVLVATAYATGKCTNSLVLHT